jgi:hypothetical protein
VPKLDQGKLMNDSNLSVEELRRSRRRWKAAALLSWGALGLVFAICFGYGYLEAARARRAAEAEYEAAQEAFQRAVRHLERFEAEGAVKNQDGEL